MAREPQWSGNMPKKRGSFVYAMLTARAAVLTNAWCHKHAIVNGNRADTTSVYLSYRALELATPTQ
jgi:hypothetical protein